MDFQHLTKRAEQTNSSALVVFQGGEILINAVLDGQERPIETMSVTKAVVSLLVGRAVTLGFLPNADILVSEFYPEWKQGKKRSITLRHLLTHRSGLQNQPMTTAEIYPSSDFVQLALCAELESMPGERFEYNNKAVNLICGLLERATSRKADEFAAAELFGPLGIEDFYWVRDAAGNPHGMSGLGLRPRDLARLGELALRGGESLISAEWISQSTSPAENPRLGFLWWAWLPELRYSVTEKNLQNLQEAGATAEQLSQLQGLYGEHTRSDFNERMAALNLDPFGFPQTEWVSEVAGPCVGFMHGGHLGQYLLIHPQSETVAVRMIDWQHPKAREQGSGWESFADEVWSCLIPDVT